MTRRQGLRAARCGGGGGGRPRQCKERRDWRQAGRIIGGIVATNRAEDVPDPIDDEIRRVLADPDVQARLAQWRDRKRRGDFPHRSHNEARAILGLPPLPEYD